MMMIIIGSATGLYALVYFLSARGCQAFRQCRENYRNRHLRDEDEDQTLDQNEEEWPLIDKATSITHKKQKQS